MTDDTQKLESADEVTALPEADEELMIESGDDLASAALASASNDNSDDETTASDQLADTLASLQNVIERNADLLTQLGSDLKLKRESLRNIFDNDTQLAEATQQQQEVTQQVKERKSKLQTSPEVTQLKTQIGELNEQKKEIEEALSNHLLNYYQLTNSMSFDTSDGDQWEFGIKAKVKGRKK